MPPARGMAEMDLGAIVLSWSIQDIMDDDLNQGQIETIPCNFTSLDHFLESYRAPLIEETRSDLCSRLELIVEAPSSKILSMEKTGKPGVYFMGVDFWDNWSVSSSGAPAVRNGGILILSSMKPEAAEDFNRYGVTYHLAIVTDVCTDDDDDDDECQKRLKIKVAKDIGSEQDLRKLRYAISLSNIITNMWIWKALSFDKQMDNNFTVIKSLLAPTNSGGDVCDMCVTQDGEYLASFTEQLLSINLNKSQMDAIGSVTAAVRCRHRNLIKLIWGPPGTGKTETASALLWALASLKCRTLTCAPTNISVIRVCTRFLQNLKNFNKNIDENGLPFSLGDVLLFGNKYNMDIPGDLQEVFLDFRVKELVECFSIKSGWRCKLSSMISFFEDCGSQYDVLLQDDGSCDPVCFIDSLKKQFNVTAAALKRCITNLWIHLPGRCFSHDSIHNISALFNMIKKIDTLLCDVHVHIISKSLKRDLSDLPTEKTVCLQPISFIGKELDGTGSTCLKLLKDLQQSLNLPIGVDKNWVQRYCMRNAMLFFCTTSSSYRLHHMEIEPFDVLIVDEAAQVRECELVIPLRLHWLKHLVLLGDDCQLSAMVKSQICKEAGFGISLFERLVMLNIEKHFLNVQYRMNPSISSFPISHFYDSKILDGPNVLSPSYNKEYTSLPFGSYAFVSVTDGKKDKEGNESCRTNMAEVAVVLHLIQTIFQSWRVSGQALSIGVVSPYSCQVDVIKDRLGNKYDTCNGFHVGVKSIDGFQGEENNIIIISTVRSNGRGDLGFLADNRRTNVALTRARHCLWIVGNATTLYKSGTVWKNLVDDALKRKCIFNASNDATMCKLILHVKQELGELDDLLNADSAVLSNTRWKVVLSDGFRKSFIKLKSPQLKREVLQKLVKLGSGWRTTVKNFDMSDTFQLAKVYKIMDYYLIWNIDLEKKERRYFQILRIWDLLPHKHVARTVQRLENLFSLYTDDYLDHCRRVQTDGKLEVPMIWDVEHDIIRYKDNTVDSQKDHDLMDTSCLLENLKVSESFLLMKFYSLSSGVAKHLLTAADGSEIDVPFELTDEEEVIIRFPHTSFTLGRSGTGKTTVLTMKLLREEQMSINASPRFNLDEVSLHGAYNENIMTQKDTSKEENFIKQVFITVSPKLCSAIKNQICSLKRFVSGDPPDQASTHHMHDIIDDMEQFGEIPDNFSDIPREHYPLVITYRKFLMMLDGTCQTSFFDIFYGELKSSTERGYWKSRALQALIELKEVTYEKFSTSYWPHFNAKLTKKLDASTVFTEIISHIKGGYQACRPITGKLEKLDYVMLSDKRFSSLNSEKRERIYDIFLDYESMKCTAREFDLSDFVNSLHKSLVSEGYNGDMVDFFYVDEVQDLTMTQIALLKYVCKNFEEGFHFAGDTAQTIARGIDFRFEDIRSLFYTTFLSENEACNRGNKHGKQGHLCDMFQLAQNFRTHCGILRMAQSIIDLLYFFFPSCVDKLNPETGLVYGEPPVLLETGNDENAIVNIFGENKSTHGNLHGFGAEQVIVVRDHATKKQIVDVVGKQALVLTIVECKGLEFQDVLLYNLFSSSPLKNRWRVVYDYMKNKDILSSPEEISHPDFDRSKHYLLCSELKQLYVAITRTRQRLWICENTDDYCRPMFDYWKKLCLVEVRLLDSSFIESMKTGSSTDDWRRRGTKLFNEGQFEMATMCFEKAGDGYRENWARAAGLIATADSVMSTNSTVGQASLQKASDIYESIGMYDKAATCYIKLGDYRRAGMLYMQNCDASRLEDAGDCFAMTECWSEAAEAYFKTKCYTKCFYICSKGKVFNLGFQFLQQLWGESLNDDSNISILYSPVAYGLIADSLGAHLRPNKKLTHGHVGRMAILLLHVVPWGDMLNSRLMQYLDSESEWAKFFRSLGIFIHSRFDFLDHIESRHPSGLDGRYSLLLNFKLALEFTFKFTLNEDWRAEPDYVSPVCYVDLIECLGYFASSCFALHGCMVSTQSICVRMAQRKNSCRFLHMCFSSTPDLYLEKMALSAGRFIFESIRDMVTKKHMIQEWVEKTSTNTDSPILLRLVVTLYVVTLTLKVGDCYEVTRFLQMHRVFEDLPLNFSQKIVLGALQTRSQKLSKFRRLFADALLEIGELMTVVASPRAHPTFPGLNALVINSFAMTVRTVSLMANSIFSEEENESCSLEKIFFRKVDKKFVLPFEEDRAGNRICDAQFWEKFEAFQVNKQGQKDAKDIVSFLKSMLSWVVQRGPPIKIDVHLLLEVRHMCDQFDEQSDVSAEAEKDRAGKRAKDLYSTWRGGERKLKKIINFLRSEKASIEEERRNAAADVVQSKIDGCSDDEPETGAGNAAEEEAGAPTGGLSTARNVTQKQKNKKSKKSRRHTRK